MIPVGFERTIPACQRPQTHALDRATTEIGQICEYNKLIWSINFNLNIENYYLICEITTGSNNVRVFSYTKVSKGSTFPGKAGSFLNKRNFLPTSLWQNVCKNYFGCFSHCPTATTDYAEPVGSFTHLPCLLFGDFVRFWGLYSETEQL